MLICYETKENFWMKTVLPNRNWKTYIENVKLSFDIVETLSLLF